MVARVIARSKLQKLQRNSVVFHILAAAADEDAEQYFQMARLRDVFSIDKATGTDLDERAAEIQPGTIRRRGALFATTGVIFTRNTTVGVLPIPIGTQVAAEDTQGTIFYRVTTAGSITGGNSVSALIPVVAAQAGQRANVADGQVNRLITKIPSLISVTNPAAVTNGRDREPDASFRRRLKDFVASLSRATDRAIESFARAVVLVNGQRVLFARLVESVVPTGFITLFIDDGAGTAESYSEQFIGGIPNEDVLIASAAGGERELTTYRRPLRDDGSIVLRRNDVPLVRGTHYEINTGVGIVEFIALAFPLGLTTGDKIAMNYRFYTGLIQEVQRVISGDPTNPLTHPGVEAGGIQTLVKPADPIDQTLVANATVADDFDADAVIAAVSQEIQSYINNLDIGEPVIVAEIIERAMSVDGMSDFTIINFNGSSTIANQHVLPHRVARINAGDITIT
jgi:uncharacterized phage protein gp47/JayE